MVWPLSLIRLKAGLRTLPEKANVSEKKPPLWTCPKCGHQFVARNMSLAAFMREAYAVGCQEEFD